MVNTLQILDGDVVVGAHTGRPNTITGKNFVKQLILENLTIDTLSNGMGAGISNLIGTIPDHGITLQLLFNDRVRNSFNAIIFLQKYYNITRSNDEIIDSVRSINISALPSDSRTYVYSIVILTKSGAQLLITNTL
jgi:hypothetical protein